MSDFFCGEFLLHRKAADRLDDFCFAMQAKAGERKIFIAFEHNLAQRIVYDLVRRSDHYPSSLCFLATSSPTSDVSDDLIDPDVVVVGLDKRCEIISRVLEDFGSLLDFGFREGFLRGAVVVFCEGLADQFDEAVSSPGDFACTCRRYFEDRYTVPSLKVRVRA